MLREATVTLLRLLRASVHPHFPDTTMRPYDGRQKYCSRFYDADRGQGYKFHSAKITTRMMAGLTIFVKKRPEPGVLTSQA